jgi:hypothetical protein
MGADTQGTIGGHYRTRPCRWIAGFSLFLLLLFLVLPATALVITDRAVTVSDPAGTSFQAAGTGRTVTTHPQPIAAVKPTLVPARQNRTALLQELEKTAAERPKVVVPVAWFIAIVVLLFIVLAAILYLLLRRSPEPPAARKNIQKDSPGRATVIEAPPAPVPVREVSPDNSGPAVQFPPTLEKRFTNPEFIGEGGLARVFRARNAKSGMTVAVKVPTRFDEITGTHFSRDIVFWQGLEHPNIIRIYSSNILPVPYIEMEYAPSSLAHMAFPLPEEKAVEIILGIARGLSYAHGKGIVHRDIKPENILIDANGVPKITDWGLGKAIGDLRQSSMIGFSPAYAAPEQIAPHRYGRPGPGTDIYQLGMLLFEMLTGSPAFRGDGMHDLNVAILEETPVLPPWNGRHEAVLGNIILRCLAKKPEERYPAVADLIRDLESVQNR